MKTPRKKNGIPVLDFVSLVKKDEIGIFDVDNNNIVLHAT